MRSFAIILVLALFPFPVKALEPMIGADVTAVHVATAGEAFNPVASRVRLGLGLNPDWEIGIVAGTGVADADEFGVTTGVGSLGAGYVRFGSSLGDGARLSLMVGYGQVTLDVTSPFPGFPGSDTYRGGLYGLSLEERLARFPHWIGSLDLERWYDDQGLKITTLSYGFRYGF